MKKFLLCSLAALALLSCHNPNIEFVDFDTFRVTSVKSADLFMEDGNLNPQISFMEGSGVQPETKLAYTDVNSIIRNMLGQLNCNRVIHISGTYTGHDVNGDPLTLSGKLIVPAKGPIHNLIIVSHYTIGANFEAPSETFPLEGVWAGKGYALVIPDYIGYGASVDRIHPYLHTESTSLSVIEMALAVKPYLKHIGREPESEQVILAGYSQGGATTVAVMDAIQDNYPDVLPIKKVYAGGGPYDLAATFDFCMKMDETGIPCAIPMIVQGINEGDHLGLDMSDFFLPNLLANYDEWINSKKYTVSQIDRLMDANSLSELMTPEGRNKKNHNTARLYQSLLYNSTLSFTPAAPMYIFHSRDDDTVPFVNAQKLEEKFKGFNIHFDFGHYGIHSMGALQFLINVYQDL